MNDFTTKVIVGVCSASLFLAGLLALAVFAFDVVFASPPGTCCATILSCYPCSDPPHRNYWPLAIALLLFASGAGLLYLAYPRYDGERDAAALEESSTDGRL